MLYTLSVRGRINKAAIIVGIVKAYNVPRPHTATCTHCHVHTLPRAYTATCTIEDYYLLSLLIDSVTIDCYMLNVSHLFYGVTDMLQPSLNDSLYLGNMINIVSEGIGFSFRAERVNKFYKSMDK